jgi:hypothetical protein
VTPARVAGRDADTELWSRGRTMISLGWGRVDDDGPISAELRRADIKVVDSSKDGLSCVGACPFEGMLIAAEDGHGHPTDGDSGGPLVTFDAQGPIVVGIYSAEMLGSHYYMRTARDPFFP